MIDLHVHTTCSDGTYSPEQIVSLAEATGLKAVAVTDHDTISGVEPARIQGSLLGIEVIPGVEISSQWNYGILHILGYFLDIQDPGLLETLDFLRRGRDERTPKIVALLNSLGLVISAEEIEIAAAGGVPGRPHIANVLVNKGYVANRQEAFDRYLKKGAPAYVDKVKLEPKKSIDLINNAGGIAVVAHPYSLKLGDRNALERVLTELIDFGLRGIEAYYPRHSREQTNLYLEIAERLDLTVTGGTDFHGENKPDVKLGVLPGLDGLPYSILENLRKSRQRGSA